MRFEVLSSSIVVGHSELEGGDPPMGVAEGIFYPLTAYTNIQADFVASRESSQDHLNLTIRLIGGETVIPIFIKIEDFSQELDEIWITACGIDHVQYQRLFPSQYNKYFNS